MKVYEIAVDKVELMLLSLGAARLENEGRDGRSNGDSRPCPENETPGRGRVEVGGDYK